MSKPAKFEHGDLLSKKEYQRRLDNHYAAKAKEKNKYNLNYKMSPRERRRLELDAKTFKGRCANKKLLRRIRNLAKEKFQIYPSAHANAWIRKEYKKRGGLFIEDNVDQQVKERRLRTRFHDFQLYKTIRDEANKRFHKKYPQISKNNWILKEYKKRGGILSSDTPQPTITTPGGQAVTMNGGELFFNESDTTLYVAKEEKQERKIVERRGDAKEGDLWINPNTGTLNMKIGDRWVTVNDPSKLPKLNNKQRRADISSAFAERHRKEKAKVKEVVLETKPKITRGQFLYKYKSPQNFYSWQDLAREHINCKYRSKQYIYDSPAYYLKDDLCNSLINTNIDNLELKENPNIVNPSFFLLTSNKINNVKYSFIECCNSGLGHELNKFGEKYMREKQKQHFKFDVYVNFVVESNKIHYYAFNWNKLNIYKFIQLPVDDALIKEHFKTVVNLILLMNQQPDIITEEYIPSKIVPLQKKYKVQSEIKPRAICWVGKDFTTRVVKLKPKQDDDFLVVSGSKRKLRPHWRRGHWHTVLKGAKRKERKMRWYQPVFVLGNAA